MYDQSVEENFLIQKFREYYEKNTICSVNQIDKREFGYGVFKRKIANRNLAFANEFAMNLFLRQRTPLFFSYSNSCYAFPGNTPMANKQWLSSDIIYEFDADEIKNNCEKINGEWKCTKTFGEESKVKETIQGKETKQWFLEDSLKQTKKQVFRLADLIENDFGFLKENISINFSGKAGYHMHLRNKEIQLLNKKSRIELVDYIAGYGIDYVNLGYEFEKQLICPKNGFWVKRINVALKDFFRKDSKEISLITLLSKTKINQILKSREEIINGIDQGYLFSVGARTNKDFWKKVFDFAVQTVMIPIDRQTSIDLHKIIRVPNTLHGETGFVAKELSLDKLESFDPFIDAIAFDATLTKIFVSETPKFKLNGINFGPFKEENIEVPLYCAIFLLGKGVAKIV
ncbi:MAG: DNA primase small subunit domain-containing protein [Candidatus ainarchaeum sp.]|nr:DNA primase small subunit domain-containing protein [Candidatus ainarchaeum sp.]